MRFVVPDDFPSVVEGSAAEAPLRRLGEVEIYTTRAGSPEELAERCRGADGLINIRAVNKFDDAFFSRVEGLRILSVWGTGIEHVDLDAARAAGVTVTNTPGVAAVSVAEHALALMFAAARRIPAIDAAVKGGDWPRGEMIQLHGKTHGIIGLGAIGRQTARITRGIGMKLIAWTFHPDTAFAEEVGLEWVALEELYVRADVISVHVRTSSETIGMIGADAFSRMKPGAILVNTARGAIVDEEALIAELREGRLGAAGLDVFETEPLPKDHPLRKLPNAVLTPHNAGMTPEVLEAGLLLSVENLARFFEGKPQNVVA